jgi:hypothetical protein
MREYPFRSTRKGASTSTGGNRRVWRGSARPIDGNDNERVGTKLGVFLRGRPAP